MAKIDYSKMFAYDESRNLYHKTLTVTLPDGTKTRKRFMAKDPEELFKKVQEFENGGRVTVQYITLQDLLEDWLEAVEKTIRYGTYKSYKPCCRLWSPLYSVTIDKLTTEMAQNRLQQLHAEGYAGKTIKTARSCLKLAYIWINPRYFSELQNPAEKAKLPKGMKSTKRHAPDDKTIKQIIKSVNCQFGLFYYTLLYTGMRRGELLGLKWADVDLENATISITKQVTHQHGKPVVGPLKTEASRRVIPILPPLLDELKERSQYKDPEEYLFGSPTDPYSPISESSLKRREVWYCREAGFVEVETVQRTRKNGTTYPYKIYHPTLTPHMLRHATATLCYEAGVDVMTTAALLGHNDISVTQKIYTELRRGHQSAELDKLVNYLKSYDES